MKSHYYEKFRIISLVLFILFFGSYIIYHYTYLKKYQEISVSKAKTRVVEYGSPNYNISDLVNNINGDIVSVKKSIDTSKVGVQKLVLELKRDNVFKDVSIDVEVKDTALPIISINRDTINIWQGENLSLLENIISVYDTVDGNLSYLDSGLVNDFSIGYYTVYTNFNYNVCGSYQVEVRAVDKHGNKSSVSFTVNVLNNDLGSRISSLALSLVGRSYVYGGVGPSSFDCSGLVQYVYRQVGLNVSRGAVTQAGDGYAVSYNEALPGDILNWGYDSNKITHSAIYIGDGKMVHAANPGQGVIISDVNGWQRGSDVKVVGVRRVK